jgi:peptide/nickel transport system ATP-binding protein/oligopeptide transport system ATP-binding protein
MQLLPTPPAEILSGEILFEGENLLNKSNDEMRKIRGNEISMIFQEPMTSLNPVFTVGNQIMEAIELHQDLSPEATRNKAIEMLRLVGIPSPEKRIDDYPHQLSGGMRQRVMIAMALSCEPKILIADEPTTALDVTIQAQIMNLISDLQQKLGMALVLITHDLGVVAESCDEVLVMYAAKAIERGDVRDLFRNPQHPYTRGLLDSLPGIEGKKDKHRLKTIAGLVPSLLELPNGCRFQDRCERKIEDCEKEEPSPFKISETHWASCINRVGSAD